MSHAAEKLTSIHQFTPVYSYLTHNTGTSGRRNLPLVKSRRTPKEERHLDKQNWKGFFYAKLLLFFHIVNGNSDTGWTLEAAIFLYAKFSAVIYAFLSISWIHRSRIFSWSDSLCLFYLMRWHVFPVLWKSEVFTWVVHFACFFCFIFYIPFDTPDLNNSRSLGVTCVLSFIHILLFF